MACRVDRSPETGDLVVCDCGYAGGPFTNAGEARDAARRHRHAHPKPGTPRQPDQGA